MLHFCIHILSGPPSWCFIFPFIHHYPSINVVPCIPALALFPLFPCAWFWEKFTERSYREATSGRKLRPLFIKRSINLNHLGRTGIPYFDCTLAPFSSNLISFYQPSSTATTASSTMSFLCLFTCNLPLSHIISYLRFFRTMIIYPSKLVLFPSYWGLLVCWLSANTIINQSNHLQHQEL